MSRGAYLLAVSAEGYANSWEEVVLANGQVTAVEIRLRPLSGSLTGKVTSASGAPVANATVLVGTWSAETDDSGTYSIAELMPGTHALQVSAAGYQQHETSVTIGPAANEVIDVSLSPLPTSLTVRVVDAVSGAPVEGAMISYQLCDGLPCADAKLLVPLKRSREYAAIRRRVADLRPTDSWQQDGLHFFTFELLVDEGQTTMAPGAPVAVFAMRPDSRKPVSAVVVTPGSNGGQVEVTDLRGSETVARG